MRPITIRCFRYFLRRSDKELFNVLIAVLLAAACCSVGADAQRSSNDAALLQVAPAKLSLVEANQDGMANVEYSIGVGSKGQINPGQSKLATIWLVWVGSNPMHPLNQAAVGSCFSANQDDFDVRVVTDEDLADSENRLGFALHPSFHLLDAPEKSDYLRAELLYNHGGFYFDADVFCMRSLRQTFEASRHYEASGIENVATIGPFKKHGIFITDWHNNLHKKMDALTPKLLECARQHPDGKGGVAYPAAVHEGQNMCGTIWGDVIDFEQDTSRQLDTQGYFGKALSLCTLEGTRWVPSLYALPGAETAPCDIVHASTARLAYDLLELSEVPLCSQFQVLRDSPHVCPTLFRIDAR